jgi:F0F1-type ATP synthase membrane subunit b/b'
MHDDDERHVNWQWVATGLVTIALAFLGYFISAEKDARRAIEQHNDRIEDRLRYVEQSNAVADTRFVEILRRLDELKAEVVANRPTVFSSGGRPSKDSLLR